MFGRRDVPILAISVVTLAEARSGFLMARWGARRTRLASRIIENDFVRIPVQEGDAVEWARLRTAARSNGIAIGDNDLWIAATASVWGRTLVTCDRDHERIAGEMPVEVLFLAPPV